MSAGHAQLHSRAGFELELLAPRGSSRLTLARALADHVDGTVRPVWHQDSEPAPVPRLGGRFLHLTKGFEVRRPAGELLCTLVDDITIADGLDPAAAALDGWHRVLTDDPRLLRLLAQICDPAGPLETALDRAGSLWGEQVAHEGNIWQLDSAGATVALAAPMGGERERPCEIITPPISTDHQARLDELLSTSQALGFTVPTEAAVHIHFDGGPFREAPALTNVIRLFAWWREPLRTLVSTNPHCRRLAPLPSLLVDAVDGNPTIAELRQAARAGSLGKFFDVNLTQVLSDRPSRDTIEIRILPGSVDAAAVIRQAAMVERLLDRCLDPVPLPRPPTDHHDALTAVRGLAAVGPEAATSQRP